MAATVSSAHQPLAAAYELMLDRSLPHLSLFCVIRRYIAAIVRANENEMKRSVAVRVKSNRRNEEREREIKKTVSNPKWCLCLYWK